MAFSLSQAMAERGANQENQFFTSLLQYSIDSAPHFDFTGKTPELISEGKPMPSKADLWNQYVQLKRGRISPEDLMKFEEMYKHVQNTRSKQQLSKINELSLRNYSDKKIRTMVKDNPIMYQNLIDMIGDLKGQGSEEATATAATIESYLPQKPFNPWEAAMEHKVMTGILGGVGIGAFMKRKELATWGKGMYSKLTAPKGPGGKPILDKAGNPIPGAGGARGILGKVLKMGPLGKYGVGWGAGMAGQGVSSVLGADPATASNIGRKVEGATELGLAAHGFKALSAAPPVGWGLAAKGVGYAGLGVLGLYNLFSSE